MLGSDVGWALGEADGDLVGSFVGDLVGPCVGLIEGDAEGAKVGFIEGVADGGGVGLEMTLLITLDPESEELGAETVRISSQFNRASSPTVSWGSNGSTTPSLVIGSLPISSLLRTLLTLSSLLRTMVGALGALGTSGVAAAVDAAAVMSSLLLVANPMESARMQSKAIVPPMKYPLRPLGAWGAALALLATAVVGSLRPASSSLSPENVSPKVSVAVSIVESRRSIGFAFAMSDMILFAIIVMIVMINVVVAE